MAIDLLMRFMFPVWFCVAPLVMHQDTNSEESAPPMVDPVAPGEATATQLPEALRNPRALRLEQGIAQGPRMMAGAISLNSEAPMEVYTRLEPIVGAFAFSGSQWARSDSAPVIFTGNWTNRWVLDGQYLESVFTLNNRSGTPYEVLGLTWYNESDQQYEARFFNSSSANQTARWGNFEEAADADVDGPDGPQADPQAAPRENAAPATGYAMLTMLGRGTNEPEGSQPTLKFEFIIISVNEFRYLGYSRSREDTGEWRKTFEMTMTRTEPIALEPG